MNAIAGVLPAAFVGYLLAVIVLWLMGALQVSDGIIGATVGAGLAAGVAIAVFWFEQKARSQENVAKLERQRLAGRMVLFFDLSKICSYAKSCADAARLGAAENELSEEKRKEIPCPSLDEAVILRLAGLASLLKKCDADLILEMMKCLQIQHDRLVDVLNKLNFPERSTSRTYLAKNDFEFTCQGTVELYLRTSAMFPFARANDGADSISLPPFTTKEVGDALWLLGLSDWLSKPEADNIISLMTGLSPDLGKDEIGEEEQA